MHTTAESDRRGGLHDHRPPERNQRPRHTARGNHRHRRRRRDLRGDPADSRTVTVINAGAGDNLILGGAGIEWIDAGAGDDVVYARGHDDVIRGDAGEDAIFGGLGFDTVCATGLQDLIADSHHGGADGYELIVQNPQPPPPRPPTAAHSARREPPSPLLERL